MKIVTANQYNEVLKRIDSLLDLSVLNPNESAMLKALLQAVDQYQLKIFNKRIPAQYKLVNEYIKMEKVLKN
jgi:hypothetical protein